MNAYVPCSMKSLPPEQHEAAAATAIEQNPSNRPAVEALGLVGMILPPEHLALLTSKYWSNKGVKLTVGFLEQTPSDLAARLLSHMNAWGQWANVQFTLSNNSPQVRITRSGDGYWSYIGTDILHIPAGQPTMCLQGFTMNTPESEYHRVVRHETGHTLGFPHEHMRREIVQAIDPIRAIAYFGQTQGWSPTVVMQQVLTPLDESSLMASPHADETSIMCYALPGSIMRDGQPVPGGSDIEEQDQAYVAQWYPKEITSPPPPKPPGPEVGDLQLSMDFTNKQVLISLPSGWTVSKKGASTMSEAQFMSPSIMAEYAEQLEAAVPADKIDAAKAHATFGGAAGVVVKLIADLKASDWAATTKDVRDLLNILLGDGSGAQFAQQASSFNFNWQAIIGVVLKLLPVLLGSAG